MGATLSIKPLEAFTKEEIADVVASYGSKYQDYRAAVTENGMDGAYLVSLNEDEFLETLDDLEITSRLHRRKLLNEFQKGHPMFDSSSSRRGSNSSRSGSVTGSGCSVFSHVTETEQEEALQVFNAIAVENSKLKESLVLLNDKSRRRASMEKMKAPPSGKAAIVRTDIEGSTSLWEADPLLMKKALHQHDQIMRTHIAANAGYEVTTEGDAFVIAFHEPADAFRFAIGMQEAMNSAAWDQGLLALPWTREDGTGRRGPKVRVSIHMGNVKTMKDPCSERVTYTGEAMDIAKSLEGLAVGGQIITSYATWEAAGDLPSQPRVASLGSHTVAPKKHRSCTSDVEPIELFEIAPASLGLLGAPRKQQ